MNAFIMHVGNTNTIDLAYTVSKACSLRELTETLPDSAPEKGFFQSPELLTCFPTGEFNCWGIPIGAYPSFKKTSPGDLVLFVPEIGRKGGVEFIGVVKATCPIRCYEASRILWPETPNERLFPWLFFFETESGHVAWEDFLKELGYAPSWNPRGWYRPVGNNRFESWNGSSGYLTHLRKQYGFAPLSTRIVKKDEVEAILPTEMEQAEEVVANIAGKYKTRSGQGFQISPKLRQAVETRAMSIAIDYFTKKGWSVEDVSQKQPYDLQCHRNGDVIHVEVKGTTSDGHQVILTPNEVEHARTNSGKTALFIVSKLQVIRPDTEEPEVTGGETKLFSPWLIEERSLKPIGFKYEAPYT